MSERSGMFDRKRAAQFTRFAVCSLSASGTAFIMSWNALRLLLSLAMPRLLSLCATLEPSGLFAAFPRFRYRAPYSASRPM